MTTLEIINRAMHERDVVMPAYKALKEAGMLIITSAAVNSARIITMCLIIGISIIIIVTRGIREG